jgi:hypothetical protein
LFCRPMNAEYQAFKFAVRRTFEYLAGAVAMFFKTDGTRIRKLATTINGREPADRVRPVQARLAVANLETIIGTDDEKSVRDLFAHYRSVDAGAINILVDAEGEIQIRVVGGGERLPAFGDLATCNFSTVLEREVAWLEDLAFGLFSDLGLLPSRDPTAHRRDPFHELTRFDRASGTATMRRAFERITLASARLRSMA